MEPKKIALLVGALVIAAITAVMAKSMFTQSAAPNAVAKMMAPAPMPSSFILFILLIFNLL